MTHSRYWGCLNLKMRYKDKNGVLCVFDTTRVNPKINVESRKNPRLNLHYAHTHPSSWAHDQYATLPASEIFALAGTTIEELLESR